MNIPQQLTQIFFKKQFVTSLANLYDATSWVSFDTALDEPMTGPQLEILDVQSNHILWCVHSPISTSSSSQAESASDFQIPFFALFLLSSGFVRGALTVVD